MKKYSKQREAVLSCLRVTYTHPTASEIFDMVRKDIPNISLATVYRNLTDLEKSGNVVSFTAPDGAVHFDGNISAHHHFCCEKCGRIIDTNDEVFDCKNIIDGNKIEHYSLMYFGKCAECAE